MAAGRIKFARSVSSFEHRAAREQLGARLNGQHAHYLRADDQGNEAQITTSAEPSSMGRTTACGCMAPAEIELLLVGKKVYERATTGLARPDVVDYFNGEGFVNVGYHVDAAFGSSWRLSTFCDRYRSESTPSLPDAVNYYG
jgi:hypothetical protein